MLNAWSSLINFDSLDSPNPLTPIKIVFLLHRVLVKVYQSNSRIDGDKEFIMSYVVKEDGLQREHNQSSNSHPTTPQQFLSTFQDKFELNILEQPDENTLVFELIHVDVSFVNALRRILIAEVPSVALETIYLWNNSSILHDEVLAHRLGLIPLNIDARKLDHVLEDGQATDRNTVVFSLKVSCPKKEPSSGEETQPKLSPSTSEPYPDDLVVPPSADQPLPEPTQKKSIYPSNRPYTMHVYSKSLIWEPQGEQSTTLPNTKVVYDDILLCKLRPGQTIQLEAHGRKSNGKDHAKYSPVCTASYRLMPCIELLHDIYDNLAEELAYKLEPGVFEVIPTDSSDPPQHTKKVRVVNPYACTMSRNYMRHETLKNLVKMSRLPHHFIFSIESVGAMKPSVLLAEALRILQEKCQRTMEYVDQVSENVL